MKIIIIFLGLFMSAFFMYSWFFYDNGIVDYVASRDKPAIKKIL